MSKYPVEIGPFKWKSPQYHGDESAGMWDTNASQIFCTRLLRYFDIPNDVDFAYRHYLKISDKRPAHREYIRAQWTGTEVMIGRIEIVTSFWMDKRFDEKDIPRNVRLYAWFEHE